MDYISLLDTECDGMDKPVCESKCPKEIIVLPQHSRETKDKETYVGVVVALTALTYCLFR